MATSPSTSRAPVTSMSTIRACACGERTKAATSASWPRSSRKAPAPVMRRRSSTRRMGSPNILVMSRDPSRAQSWSAQLRGAKHGGDDVLVARATAQVAGDHLAGVVLARVRRVAQAGGDRRQEARRTEAALQPVAVLESLLHRRELAAVAQPLDGRDLVTVDADREQQARPNRLAVQQHSACATDTVFAADVCAGEPHVVAQAVREQAPRRDSHGMRRTVDDQSNVVIGHAAASAAAARTARTVSAPARWRRYSALAWMSASGSTDCTARWRTSSSDASNVAPSSAEVRSTTSGVGATDTYAARTDAMRRSSSSETIAQTPHTA